jgi:hypothetical protein
MTPKEKAIELYNNFYNTSSHPHHVESRQQFAKQCTLIAVDEILNVIIGSYDYELEKIYWQEVKQEIEKL